MKINKLSIKTLAIHAALWALYILSEYLANLFHLDSSGEVLKFLKITLLSLPILMVPTYLMAKFVVPNYLQNKQYHYFTIFTLLVLGFVFWGRIWWMQLINYLEYDHFNHIPATKVLKNVIRDYAVIALAVCIYIISDWRKKARLNLQLIESKAKIEMQLLKSQLHPHFLFNTINNIYSLALKKSDLAAEYILKLSHLLDYLVYQTENEKVNLSLEIELIKNYINLEKLRHGDLLEVTFNVTGISESIKTPPLILLPFIENCFKHGAKNEDGLLVVHINIQIYNHLLILNVENSKNNKKKKRKNSGVGLANIKKRLSLLYPDKYKLQLNNSENSFSVTMELDLK